ncbi:MAG: hypothetical protein D6730_00035 [Bacteroidetes bacterium]|nr:MAG: hypothetical protein D6730_00035 [Bacteroidota bacterium]
MLTILCPHISNRLKYTCQVIFNQLLPADYRLREIAHYEPEKQDFCISYGLEEPPPFAHFHIPHTGLLFEEGVREIALNIREEELPMLFYVQSMARHSLSFDFFSAAFFLLSQYEKYQQLHTDAHGRYQLNAYPSQGLQLHRLPLLHLYAAHLKQRLLHLWPELPLRPAPAAGFHLTIDVDHPWKYLHKGPLLFWGGMLKDALAARHTQLRERWQSWRTGHDPHDTFELLFEHCPPQKTTFFFLIDRHSPHDNRFGLQHPAYRRLIAGIHQRGYTCGIHPSYTSFMNEARIHAETQRLAHFLGQQIRHSRQHFLKYRLPHTFRHLEAAGLQHDYTLCNYQSGGFPSGMARPFRWYDLQQERISSLWLHPTIMMDWSLLHYLALQPEAAVNKCQQLIKTCRQVGGIFTFLLHNDALSNSPPWKGWKPFMLQILQLLQQ